MVKLTALPTLRDLKIGVGAPGSGTEANFRQLLGCLRYEERGCEGTVSVLFGKCRSSLRTDISMPSSSRLAFPNAAIMDVAVMQSIRILSIPDDKVAQLTKKYPFLSPVMIARKYVQEPDGGGEDRRSERSTHCQFRPLGRSCL